MRDRKPFDGSRPIRSIVGGGVVRMRGGTFLCIAVIFSLCFILALSCAFWGDNEDEPYFKGILNEVASTNPGIVLLGENVDVDIDEPSIGIRWSILGCGDGFFLNGSTGVHDSDSCGLPSTYLQIYVDGSVEPTAIYDPSQLPFATETGRRHNIQNLVRFSSDHTLDVHLDRLYPFDTYLLTTTIRASDASNSSVPIRKLATLDQVASFLVSTSDMDSYEIISNGTHSPSRDIDMRVQRPGQARAFTLFLFGLNWMLAHVTIGNALLARKHKVVKPILKHIGSALAILLVIPRLRDAMPDAPGYDGILLDYIGFFPQMIISAASVLVILLLIMLREFDDIAENEGNDGSDYGAPTRIASPSNPSNPPSRNLLKSFVLGSKKRDISVNIEQGRLPGGEHQWEEKRLQDYEFPSSPSSPFTPRHQHLRSRSSRVALLTPSGERPSSTYGYELSRSSSYRSKKAF
ncbi:hypothetical protein ID866_3117 [Astraeus odoratus]|nr:hypothetical protein ID866_3117 [Astraeus odoratus]